MCSVYINIFMYYLQLIFLTCLYQRSRVAVSCILIYFVYICIIYTTFLYFSCRYQQQQPLFILSLNKANNLILVFLGHRLMSVLNHMTQETTAKKHITVVFLVGTKRKYTSHVVVMLNLYGE
jgi:hypothetical protein